MSLGFRYLMINISFCLNQFLFFLDEFFHSPGLTTAPLLKLTKCYLQPGPLSCTSDLFIQPSSEHLNLDVQLVPEIQHTHTWRAASSTSVQGACSGLTTATARPQGSAPPCPAPSPPGLLPHRGPRRKGPCSCWPPCLPYGLEPFLSSQGALLLSSKLFLDIHRKKTSSRIQRFLSLSGIPICPASPMWPCRSQQARTLPYTFTFVPFLM